LVIDDSSQIHDLVRYRLKYDALEVISASDGASGLGLSITAAPDLILLDIDMPGMNGFQVCERLKEDPGTSHIPVLFITTEGTVEQKVRGLAVGASDYVTKPFDATELRARVHASLRGKQDRDHLVTKVMVDGLTELWNGDYFHKQLKILMVEAKRSGWPLSCIALDVDRLSAINIQFRECAGDAVLLALAQRIAAQCRAEDIPARLFGGTFAILSRNTDRTQAATFVRRLWVALASRPVIHREASLNFKCSFGVGTSDASEICDPLQAARQALDRAKAALGGGMVIAQPTCHKVSPSNN
jgi:two-component system, cell cycle response regulator